MRRLVVVLGLVVAASAALRGEDPPKVSFTYELEVHESTADAPFARRSFRVNVSTDVTLQVSWPDGAKGSTSAWVRTSTVTEADRKVIADATEVIDRVKDESLLLSKRGEAVASVSLSFGKEHYTVHARPGHLAGKAKKLAPLFALGERLKDELLAELDRAPPLHDVAFTERTRLESGDLAIVRLETNAFGSKGRLIDAEGQARELTLFARHEEIERAFANAGPMTLPARATAAADGAEFELELTFATSAGEATRRCHGALRGAFVAGAKGLEPLVRILDDIVKGLGQERERMRVSGRLDSPGGTFSGGFGDAPADEDDGSDTSSTVFLTIQPASGERVHLAVDRTGRLLFPGWEKKRTVEVQGEFQPGTRVLHVKRVRLRTDVKLAGGETLEKGTFVKLLKRNRKTEERYVAQDDIEGWVDASAIFGEAEE